MNFYTEELLKTLDEENYTEFKKKCSTFAQDVQFGRITFLQIIEELRELLTNPSPSKRGQGVYIFTEVLQNLPSGFLSVQELKTITDFYTEKLGDRHQMLPKVLEGILTLIKFEHFPEEIIPLILNTIFLSVACQQQQQADRLTIYEIFQVSLERYKQELVSMQLNLVYGVISSIDGERDPRNLMFLFKWLKLFLTSISLGHLTEEMFEVVACYFPVDFKVPSSQLNGITREDLANELCPCLCATPEFAEYAITLALEKLDSSLQIAKLDSLNLLRQGCTVFSSSSYLTQATQIWSQLQKEVFSDTEDVIKLECLKTLTVIISKISQNGDIISLLSNIVSTLKGNLIPGSQLFHPSINVLLYTALASHESSVYIIKEIVPILINTFVISHDSVHKTVMLKALTEFVKAHLKYSNEKIFTENGELNNIPVLCLKASSDMDNSLRSAAFDSLADLAENMPLDVRLPLYEYLHKVIIKSESIEVRTSILKCFKRISVFYPEEVNSHVLYCTKISNHSDLNLYLNALCYIVNINQFREIVIDSLITYAVDDDVELAGSALRNIESLLEKESNNRKLLESFLQKAVINTVIEYANKISYANNNIIIELLKSISSILKILIGSQNHETQSEIIKCQLNIINNYYEESEELYVLLLDGLISRLCKGLAADSNMLALLTKISIANNNALIRDTSVQLLANIINKYPDGDPFIRCLDIIKHDCLLHIDTNKFNVIITLSWVTKALVMRNHLQANFWTDMLLEYLEHDMTAATGFKIIMNNNYGSLSSVSYSNIMTLYQQKFFVLVTNKLCTNFSPEKISYLIAVGYLIENVSEQALLLQFKKILKLIILCLEQCGDPEVLCVILRRVKKFISQNESILQENLEDFLLRIMNLTTFENSMDVRIAALQCLNHFSCLPLYRILPFKQRVLYQLGHCVDDKKRLVRKEAMAARSLWFLLDAPI